MASWQVPLAEVTLSEDDIAAVADTYRSGWLSMGPRTEAFERRLGEYTGARHAVAVSSGTAGLHLMCLAAGLAAGDEVVVPSLTFVATVNAIAYTGAIPVFADIAEVARPWLSADAAEAAITPATRAIMAMEYGGHPGEIAALRDLAARRGLLLLEDAAHAIGARLGDQYLGTFGLAGAFSFFANKNLPIGEGGAVVTDDDALAERIRLLRSHGMTSLSWDRHRGHSSTYDVVALGFNYRIDEARATLAARLLGALDAGNRRRRDLDRRYREQLPSLPGITPTAPPPDEPRSVAAHHLFTVVLDEGVDRDGVRETLARRGVQTSVHYPPAHRFPIHAAHPPLQLPLTEAYAERAFSLPLFPTLSDDQFDLVVSALSEALSAQVP